MKRRVFALTVCFLGVLLYAWPTVATAGPQITAATLGTAIDADYEIVKPADQFAANTANIYCAWAAEGLEGDTVVRGVWIATDVGKVAPANYKIDEAQVKLSADGKGSFSMSKPNNGFPVGQYRVEIYFGDKLAKIVPFTVN
jgi:hypothetical protein